MKNNTIQKNYKHWILFPLAIISILALIFYSLSPKFVDIRNSSIANFIFKISLSLFLVYLSFFQKNKLPIPAIVIIFIFILLLIGGPLLRNKRLINLLYLIYGYINIIYYILYYIKYKVERKSIWCIGALSILVSTSYILRITYVNTNFPFWKLTLVVSIAAFLFSILIVFFFNHLITEKQNRFWIPLLGLMAGFILPWLTISTLNYNLDKSSPTYESYEIIDKDIRTGARQITTYELTVKKNDKTFDISVDDEDYYKYEVGEYIVISIYSGAFNESYYIYEPL